MMVSLHCPDLELVQSQKAEDRNRTIFQGVHRFSRKLNIRAAVELVGKTVGAPADLTGKLLGSCPGRTHQKIIIGKAPESQLGALGTSPVEASWDPHRTHPEAEVPLALLLGTQL